MVKISDHDQCFGHFLAMSPIGFGTWDTTWPLSHPITALWQNNFQEHDMNRQCRTRDDNDRNNSRCTCDCNQTASSPASIRTPYADASNLRENEWSSSIIGTNQQSPGVAFFARHCRSLGDDLQNWNLAPFNMLTSHYTTMSCSAFLWAGQR